MSSGEVPRWGSVCDNEECGILFARERVVGVCPNCEEGRLHVVDITPRRDTPPADE